jgi:hypothetical protein
VCKIKTLTFSSLEKYVEENLFIVDGKNLSADYWNFQNTSFASIFEKIKINSTPLGEHIGKNIFRGILTGFGQAFIIDEETRSNLIKQDPKSGEVIKPFLTGSEVQRYYIEKKKKYIILTKIGINIKNYPAIFNWLNQFRKELEKRWDKGNYWYELRACDFYDNFEKPKIIYGKITTKPRFSIDDEGYYVNDANFIIPASDYHLLGILNSKLGWFFISNICTQIRGGYQLIWKYFRNFPIPKDKSPELEKLVKEMLHLCKKYNVQGISCNEKERIEQQIRNVDYKIDQEVFNLYCLTKEEQKIIDDK